MDGAGPSRVTGHGGEHALAITPAAPPVRATEGPMRLTRFVHAVRTSLWLVPLLCVLAGVLIVLGTLWLDRRSGYTLVRRA